jgi:hypothetical protein
MQRLVSGASRVIALIVESGIPGRRADLIASLRCPRAACSTADTSVSVRETSMAASIARSAIPGCDGSEFSNFTFRTCFGHWASLGDARSSDNTQQLQWFPTASV